MHGQVHDATSKRKDVQPVRRRQKVELGYRMSGKRCISVGIKYKNRRHTAILGEEGCGKTSMMRHLIRQDLEDGSGVLLLDYKRALAGEILSMVPPSRYDDLVYLSPASIASKHNTIRLNPSITDNKMPGKYGSMDVIYDLVYDVWNYHAHMITHFMDDLIYYGISDTSYYDIMMVPFDQGTRTRIVNNCDHPMIRNYWNGEFRRHHRQHDSRQYSKIRRQLQSPVIRSLFDTTRPTMSVSEMIRKRKIVIMDLGIHDGNEMDKFIGNLMLNLFYYALHNGDMDINNTPESFNIYIDGVEGIKPITIFNMLSCKCDNKFKMTFTLSSIGAISQQLSMSLLAYIDHLVTFKSDAVSKKWARHEARVGPISIFPSKKHSFSIYDKDAEAIIDCGFSIPHGRWSYVPTFDMEKHYV